MGRQNNTARSLIIISKQQGWDPDVIQNVGNGPGHPEEKEYRVSDVYHVREEATDGDTWAVPECMADPQATPGGEAWVEESPFAKRATPAEHPLESDPYPAMPGARPERGR